MIQRCIFVTVLLLFSISFVDAQWMEELPLTTGTPRGWTGYATGRGLEAEGDRVHAVIMDERSGCWQPYYMRSTDGGASWGDAMLLTDTAECYAGYPAICRDGMKLYVAWHREEGMDMDMYMRRSDDGGATWSAKDTVTNDEHIYEYTSIAVDGDVLHLVAAYKEILMTYSSDIYYLRSTDRGRSWQEGVKISDAAERASLPCVRVSDGIVHVAWFDNDPSSRQLYYARSTDGGDSWSAERQLTDAITFHAMPSLAADGLYLHIAYQVYVDGKWQIRLLSSEDYGESWSDASLVVGEEGGSAVYPALVYADSRLHMTWVDTRSGNYDACYAQSLDRGAHWSAVEVLGSDPGNATRPVIAVNGDAVHVMWLENQGGTENVYYRRNPSRNVTGIHGSGIADTRDFGIRSVYPHPVRSGTTITYALTHPGMVRVVVHDMLGRRVAELHEGVQAAGVHEITWRPNGLPPGSYFCRITANDRSSVKLLLLR